VNMLITIHCILTLTIVINPINQEAAELFDVPQEFCMKRVIVRVGMMVAVVFAAESVPTFGPLLDLVGGSTLTLTSIIFPCVFYLYLAAGDKKSSQKGKEGSNYEQPTLGEIWNLTSGVTLAICIFIIVVGAIGGAAATFSAINGLATTHFVPPCYVQPFLASNGGGSSSSFNCCGHGQNITAHEGITCSKPDLNFYG